MNALSIEEIKANRAEAMKFIHDNNIELLDNIFTDSPPKNCNSEVYYLSKAIGLMVYADFVIFLPGWKESRGCNIEHMICERYNIPRLYL